MNCRNDFSLTFPFIQMQLQYIKTMWESIQTRIHISCPLCRKSREARTCHCTERCYSENRYNLFLQSLFLSSSLAYPSLTKHFSLQPYRVVSCRVVLVSVQCPRLFVRIHLADDKKSFPSKSFITFVNLKFSIKFKEVLESSPFPAFYFVFPCTPSFIHQIIDSSSLTHSLSLTFTLLANCRTCNLSDYSDSI